ncbi:hypothetical protein [Shewanella nanhaiensis]|uniref:DUF4870 domain-containing protein n=1 Tax=Shewanella nanhaiensis TaxID=2864872 RepID=A0ABS7E2V7_9GAMM|nr:hypothetical protein [Shewanella nanhaiensis]MBW8183673.1 hypothetical protein [Shewanella nanhaiensis]
MISTATEGAAIDDPSLAHLLYGLMTAFPLFFLPTLLGLAINLAHKPQGVSAMVQSHLRWQRHSMIGFAILAGVGFFLSPLWLSVSIYLVATLWFCHRIIKGWLSLTEGVEV